MPAVPAHCDHCNLTFQRVAGGIVFENSTNITLAGGFITCPRCHRPARLIEGTFNFRDNVIEVLTAPDWTRERLEELRATLQVVARNWAGTDATEVVRQVAEVSPEAATRLEQALSYGRANALELILSLLAVIGLLFPDPLGFDDDPPPAAPVVEVHITPEELAPVLDQIEKQRAERAAPHGQPLGGQPQPGPPAPGSPTPPPPPPAGP